MAAVWMRLRAEARTRWRAWLTLALIFGLGSGAAIATLAGARRTETAYPRFLEAHEGFDAYSGGGAEDMFDVRFEELKTHPAVESAEEVVIVGGQLTIPASDGAEDVVLGFPDALVVTNPSGRVLYETNRAKILDGRLPRKADPHEVVVPFLARDRFGVDVGDEIVVGMGFNEDDFSPLAEVPVRVVGVMASPGDFEAVGQTLFLAVYGTPAMFEKYSELVPFYPDLWNLGFHLKGGPTAAVAFKQDVERRFSIDIPVIQPVIRSGVQKTMRLYAVALWVVGALIAVATVAIVGQTLARQTTLDSSDHGALRALGFSPPRLVGLGMLRAGAIGVTAAAIATITAYLGSRFFPIGPARTAEPFPGFMLDATLVGLGALTVLILVPLITVLPSLRAVRAAGLGDAAQDLGGGSRLVRALSGIARSPATSAGLRMALEPGRGRSAVPVRSTILAGALGIAALASSLVVGRSMDHLIDTPELAGFTYDALLPQDDEPEEGEQPPDPAVVAAERMAALRKLPFVDGLAVGTALNIVVGGADSFLLAFAEEGDIEFAIIDGRAPTDAPQGGLPEIALGAVTMRRMQLSVGDTVEFSYPPEMNEPEESPEDPPLTTQRARIVGSAAVPSLPFAVTEPGEGGFITTGALRSFDPEHDPGCCYVAFKDGTDLGVAQATLQETGFVDVFLRTERSDLATLERLSRLPIALSALFAVMGAAAVAHVLVTAVRRRKRELAIMKTLGFVNGQVRTAVAWQVTTIVLLFVAIGIPLGITLGRWGWSLVAAHFAVVPVAVAPAAVLAIVLPAALVLGNVVAAIPGRIAARTQPALVLRTE